MSEPTQGQDTTKAQSQSRPSGPRHEQGAVDEQFRSLLEGLRTSLPGIQVLFGFLLVAPFQSDFNNFDDSTVTSFTVAFFAAGLASVLLISPSVHQRVRAPTSGLRRHSKRHLLVTTWLTIAGTIAMGVAIVSTVFLVSSFVFDGIWPTVSASAIAIALLWAWFYIPLVTFRD